MILLFAVAMQACAKKNTLTSSWVDDSFARPIKGKILVLGVFKNPTTHKIYEDSFVASLVRAGVNAVPSYNYAQTYPRHTKGWLDMVVKESGASFVLMPHFINEKKDTDNFRAEGVILGGGMSFNSFGQEYSYIVEETFKPGFNETRTTDFIKVTLFDEKSDKPVWSAVSKSINFNPYYRAQDIQLDNVYIKDMKAHGLL